MTPAQCRAGRTLVDMSQAALAAVANVPRGVIVDFELSALPPKSYLQAMQRALEQRGVEFVEGERPGTRL